LEDWGRDENRLWKLPQNIHRKFRA
jgi:hypothetical protein